MDKKIFTMYDALRLLDDIYTCQAAEADERTLALKRIYSDILMQVVATAGKAVLTAPLRIRKSDGSTETYPDIIKHSLV